MGAVRLIAEHRTHRETVADPMAARRAVDTTDLLHLPSPNCGETRVSHPDDQYRDGTIDSVDSQNRTQRSI
ncbi:hypothetical protein MYA_1048 [Burkholderia sp. KJ006]|nr:hypothetical protein MYA_1048 [Burkholderia sp. KJ006]